MRCTRARLFPERPFVKLKSRFACGTRPQTLINGCPVAVFGPLFSNVHASFIVPHLSIVLATKTARRDRQFVIGLPSHEICGGLDFRIFLKIRHVDEPNLRKKRWQIPQLENIPVEKTCNRVRYELS